jgi:D-alanine transaminase
MSRIAYVNGQYVLHGEAVVHVEDRGYQFADGVYEVINIDAGQFVDEEPHLDRLDRSLDELRIAWPMSRRAMKLVMRQVIRRNMITDGLIYIQITRGVAPRDHGFPEGVPSSIVMTAKTMKQPSAEQPDDKGVAAISLPDIRWSRPDIKSVALLPNVICKQKAREAGAYEALLVDAQGFVTEGSSTNAWIVTKNNEVVTRATEGNAILNGITRQAFIKLMAAEGLVFVERKFTIAEAIDAKECFVTASSTRIKAVVSIDGKPVGNGHPGETVARLRRLYWQAMKVGGVLPKVPTNIREMH